jgi:hypothetical protein
MALGAFAILVYDAFHKNHKAGGKLIVANTVVHGLLVLTHIYGFLYSSALMISDIIVRWRRGRLDGRFGFSAFLGWMTFLVWLKPYLSQLDVVRPRNWIAVPSVWKITQGFASGMHIALPLSMLVLAAFLSLIGDGCEPSNRKDFKSGGINTPSMGHLEILGLCLVFFVPSISWLISRIYTPIFYARYFIVVVLGWAILTSYIMRLLLFWQLPIKKFNQQLVIIVITLIFVSRPISISLLSEWEVSKPGSEEANLYPNLPVVMENYVDFMPRYHYSSNKNRYFFVLDKKVMVEREANIAYKEMKAIAEFYLPRNILNTEQFLAQHKAFLVFLDKYNHYAWYSLILASNKSYNTTVLNQEFVLVEKIENT